MKLMKYVRLTLTLLVFSIGIANAQHNTDYVDLGLPSGTLWATCNVGAAKPWEYGEYFAWGETRPNTDYSWTTYKYANGAEERLTKYCHKSSRGNYFFSDDIMQLESSDDAATARMGSKWRIPTSSDWEELFENCSIIISSIYCGSGVTGRIFISNKYPNREIFLPAAGYKEGCQLYNDGDMGSYWSSSLFEPNPSSACTIYFYGSWKKPFDYSKRRAHGLTIRAVR